MTTVKDILEYIETLAPSYMKEDWDRVGLNCGHLDRPVTKILVALDPFAEVCEEAAEMEALNVTAMVFGVKMELLGWGCQMDFDSYKAFYRDHYNPWAAEHVVRPED